MGCACLLIKLKHKASRTGMPNSVPLGGSSAYNSYNAAAFAAQFAVRTAAAAAAASKPKVPQQPKPAKQVVDDEDEIADHVAEYDK
jgi:phosphoribosylcarboxyaminoimidazole (NCAIR) mutase